MPDLVGNPEYRFSRDAAQKSLVIPGHHTVIVIKLAFPKFSDRHAGVNSVEPDHIDAREEQSDQSALFAIPFASTIKGYCYAGLFSILFYTCNMGVRQASIVSQLHNDLKLIDDNWLIG